MSLITLVGEAAESGGYAGKQEGVFSHRSTVEYPVSLDEMKKRLADHASV